MNSKQFTLMIIFGLAISFALVLVFEQYAPETITQDTFTYSGIGPELTFPEGYKVLGSNSGGVWNFVCEDLVTGAIHYCNPEQKTYAINPK